MQLHHTFKCNNNLQNESGFFAHNYYYFKNQNMRILTGTRVKYFGSTECYEWIHNSKQLTEADIYANIVHI